MVDLIFIGGVGKADEFGGELSKNKLIISRLKKSGLDVDVVDTYGSHRNPLKLWRLPYSLVANPSALVVFSTSFGNIHLMSSLIARIYPQRRLLLWVIGGILADELSAGSYSVDDFNIFETIFVESKSMRDKMLAEGVKHAVYLPNFKDMSLSAGTCRFDGIDGQLRCVFFSRIDPLKGVDVLLDALESETLKGKNISVDFYGPVREGYEDAFMARVGRLDNVNYRGLLNFFDGSAQKTLTDYHLALFPTFWLGEGFPGVVVDAFSAGLPILASDWQHNAEIITSDVGFLCKAGDMPDFANKLSEIYDNRMQLLAFSANCKAAASHYDVDVLLDDDFVSRYISGRQTAKS